jgi:hypothetical protein
MNRLVFFLFVGLQLMLPVSLVGAEPQEIVLWPVG